MAYPPPSLFPGLHALARPDFTAAAISAAGREQSLMSGITSSPVAISSYHQVPTTQKRFWLSVADGGP
jgi:hypothetical protein